jgi:hypothetical protein
MFLFVLLWAILASSLRRSKWSGIGNAADPRRPSAGLPPLTLRANRLFRPDPKCRFGCELGEFYDAQELHELITDLG